MLDIMNYYSCVSTVEQFLLKTNLTEIDEMQLYFYNIISVTIVKQITCISSYYSVLRQKFFINVDDLLFIYLWTRTAAWCDGLCGMSWVDQTKSITLVLASSLLYTHYEK